MSTVSTSRPPKQPPGEPDPFRYGWRFVRVTRPDGVEELDQVPLTLEDVLHPEEGDFIVQSNPHDIDRAYLRAVFEARLEDDSTAVVLSESKFNSWLRSQPPNGKPPIGTPPPNATQGGVPGG